MAFTLAFTYACFKPSKIGKEQLTRIQDTPRTRTVQSFIANNLQ